MEKVDFRPLPNWTLVTVTWDQIMNHPHYPIREILKWVEDYSGSRYHLQGHNYTDGFEFRFENPQDATYFKLRWL